MAKVSINSATLVLEGEQASIDVTVDIANGGKIECDQFVLLFSTIDITASESLLHYV